jgi:oxygen-independent coproporphyrinogen-3 oxidase
MVIDEDISFIKNYLKYPQPLVWATSDDDFSFDPKAIFNAGIQNHHIANTAYPIAHRSTIWNYRLKPDEYADAIQASFAVNDEFCLYAHIPFCERRCGFCEYVVMDSHDEETEAVYHQALMSELALYVAMLDKRVKLGGFDIGGGTPALIQPHRIGQLVEQATKAFNLQHDFSMSIETTPKIAATMPDRLANFRSFGIDRISMGLQMVNPKLMRQYGRDINKVGYNRKAVDSIRKAGFNRMNLDIMYGFASQDVEDVIKTVQYAVNLSPEYVTLYRMRYKGTKIVNESTQIHLAKVNRMYEAASALLLSERYEANPGKNTFSKVQGDSGASAYLTKRVAHSVPYLGVGLGAQTFANNLLAYNLGAATKKMERYCDAVNRQTLPIQDLYRLPLGEGMAKMIAVSFYFGEIQLNSFQKIFGVTLQQRFPKEIAFALNHGFMQYHGDTLRLTKQGARVFNGLVALFYSNAVKRYLLEGGQHETL